jgi:hypothetical protein
MNLFHPHIAAALAATVCMAACVAPPGAPTIPVAPGPHTTFDRFGADQATCEQYAAAQIAPAVAAANKQAVGYALLGAALGAGLGAGIGAAAGNASKGAAIGAASGGALGIIGNTGGAPYPQESLQQQYDIMYGQCMAANGNSVPTCPHRRAPRPIPAVWRLVAHLIPMRWSRRRATEPSPVGRRVIRHNGQLCAFIDCSINVGKAVDTGRSPIISTISG